MIKIAVCDDDKKFAAYEKQEISRVLNLQYPYLKYELAEYNSGQALLGDIMAGAAVDVVMLDIELKEESGFEIATALNHISTDFCIVFVTSHDNLVYDSFTCYPSGFVRKDLFAREFKQTLYRIINKLIETKNMLHFGPEQDGYDVAVSDIFYVEVFDHEMLVHFREGEIKVRDKMTNHEKVLSSLHFIKICRGCMVNMRYIYSVDGAEITLCNQVKVLASRRLVKTVDERYREYLRNR